MIQTFDWNSGFLAIHWNLRCAQHMIALLPWVWLVLGFSLKTKDNFVYFLSWREHFQNCLPRLSWRLPLIFEKISLQNLCVLNYYFIPNCSVRSYNIYFGFEWLLLTCNRTIIFQERCRRGSNRPNYFTMCTFLVALARNYIHYRRHFNGR